MVCVSQWCNGLCSGGVMVCVRWCSGLRSSVV